MNRTIAAIGALIVAALSGIGAPGSAMAQANVDGVAGTTFNLTAKADYITTADGSSLYLWGYALDGGTMQYPGPTLIVNQGDTVTVTLNNNLPQNTSIVFPGQDNVTASGGVVGLVGQESTGPLDTVTYSFVASRPGTFMYHSGTRPDIQVQLGLVGALIVRPTGYDAATNRIAYGNGETVFDHEYLFLVTEMDDRLNQAAETEALVPGTLAAYDTSTFWPTYWFINGRTAPDTMMDANAVGTGMYPNQPYNIVPRAHPGDRVLLRLIAAGRDLHPFHPHGNNVLVIGRDGQLLESAPGAGPDVSFSDYTIKVEPGATYDAIFQWTGKGMGWDIYGTGAGYQHTCVDTQNNTTGALTADGFDDTTWEYCPDHGKPFPVTLPGLQNLTFGGFYSGSPYLGHLGSLPPGQGGLNANGGFHFMWHSHAEKEMINFDVFPGGMMSMFTLEPPGIPIP